jgi:hypothetical protein
VASSSSVVGVLCLCSNGLVCFAAVSTSEYWCWSQRVLAGWVSRCWVHGAGQVWGLEALGVFEAGVVLLEAV